MGKRRRSELNESEGDESPSTAAASQAKKARADKWSFPEELRSATHICQKLYDFLRKVKDKSNRILCEFLIRVPSRRSLPQYYEVVQTPIDLMKIQQKLKTDEYRSVHQFISDVRLLLTNAMTFYGSGSEEHQWACELEQAFVQKLHEYGGWSLDPATPTDSSPPSLTLRIPKDHIRSLSSSKSGQPSSKSGSKTDTRSKVTRSKAWLADYLQSGDPLKMFLAAVYDHHDSTGTCVAEVFHELPSSKDYPEYYRVITEPIDLNMMKRNLEGGQYSNLRQLQEDMILMVKNAHHFNEPGSDIYKMASSLRKFIINHCAELERKYQTIPKSVSLKVSLKRPSVSSEGGEEGRGGGEGEEKKVPKLRVRVSGVGGAGDGGGEGGGGGRGGGGVKVGKQWSRVSKTPEAEDSEESESSVEEMTFSDGEEEEEEEEERQRERKGGDGKTPAKRIKTTSGKERGDRITKLLKSRKLPSLKKRLMAVYHRLVNHTDDTGRYTSELFMRKPSVKAYPEYYLVIKKPIDFHEIVTKIKQDQYPAMDDLMADVELLVNNALTFNEEESAVYQDALTIQRLAKEAVQQLSLAWSKPQPAPRGRGRPRKSISGAEVGVVLAKPLQSPTAMLYSAVQTFTLQGRSLWRTFQTQSTTGVSSDPKKIADFSGISTKYATSKYSTVHQLYEDLHLLFDHVCHVHPKESLQYRDALVLCRVAAKKYLELTAEERKTSRYPNAPEVVRGLLRSILSKTLLFQDTHSGSLPAESLKDVALTQEIPADGDEPPVSRTLSLSSLEQSVGCGHYRRLDAFQRDLFAVLRHARDGCTKGGQVWRDSVALQKAFISARDQVCKGGEVLWSPALSYSESDLEQELATSSRPAEGHKGSPESKPQGAAPPQPEKKGSKEYFDRVTIGDTTYHVGDTVYVTARVAGQKPHVVLIEKLWKDTADTFWLDGCWYYRPEETFHLATRKFYEKEVFKSDFRGVAKLSDVKGKCYVLVVKDFVRLIPEGFSEEDVYVCESRYAHKAKSFKKVKNWSYPAGRQPQLIARDSPILLSRVPSVFMTQSTRTTGSSSHPMGSESDLHLAAKDVMMRDSELSGDAVETSFFEDLENVRATGVSNPSPDCAYYEQYCIDEDRFRLGDCVYVRSDQEKPFIARIDRMWTDVNGDPWFHGPWFVYPEEVEHLPTRLFMEQELFMSSIHDTNPMRSIIGRCAVLHVSDYCRKRPTEFSENDVFVVESRYQEAEAEIRRLPKGLKQFQLSKEVQLDEVYYFQQEIHPMKVPSLKLLTYNPPSLPSSSPLPSLPTKQLSTASSLPSQPSSGQSTPALSTPSGQQPSLAQPSSSSGTQPTPLGGPQAAASMLSINPQLLQALLASASQTASSKPVIIPLQQSPISTQSGTRTGITTPPAKPPPPAPPTTITPKQESKAAGSMSYVCQWDECGEYFETLNDLTTHLMLNASTCHVVREADGNYYCRWATCPRNPRHGGRAFDAMPKITRHVKEVHLLKLSQTALGLNPRSHVIQGQALRPPPPQPAPSPTPPPAPIAPAPSTFQITLPPTLPSSLPSLSSLPSSLPIAQVPSPSPAPQATPTATSTMATAQAASVTTQTSNQPAQTQPPPPAKPTKPTEISSLFLPPPENKKPLLHSAIYTKYIQNLQRSSHHMSSMVTSDRLAPEHRPATQQPVKVSDWLEPAAIPQNTSVSDALWTLRDHLLKDSLRLGQHTHHFQ